MIIYQGNILEKLKTKGYSQYRIRKEKLLSGQVITKLQKGDTNLTLETLDQICTLLDCEVYDVITHSKNKGDENGGKSKTLNR